jgi:hypothetical protein
MNIIKYRAIFMIIITTQESQNWLLKNKGKTNDLKWVINELPEL